MTKREDLVGRKFGRLIVVEYDHTTKLGLAMWKCTCECGRSTVVSGGDLKRGGSKSCGCLKRDLANKRFIKNILNIKFGRLLVVERVTSGKYGTRWKCLCDCGNTKVVYSADLCSGRTRSCGCLRSEIARNRIMMPEMQVKSGNKNHMYGKPSPHSLGSWFEKRNGERVWLRSSYEHRVATILEDREIDWVYENRFNIGEHSTWAPDFYLPEWDIYIEVKGYLRKKDRIKLVRFREMYPNISIMILDICGIKLLESGNSIIDVGTTVEEYLTRVDKNEN